MRYLIILLLLVGCEDAPVTTVVDDVNYELVDKQVKVRYIDSNCLDSVIDYNDLINGYVAYDNNSVYRASGEVYFNYEYYRLVGSVCSRTVNNNNQWVSIETYHIDSYKVIDGELYISSVD